MANKFKDVIEHVETTNSHTQRTVDIKVTKKEVIRTTKKPKWEDRFDVKKIHALGMTKGKRRELDRVHLELKGGKEIEWELKKGKPLYNCINTFWIRSDF